MAIARSKRRVSAARIAALARDLLHAAPLCAIATVASGDRAHVNTAYFAWSDDFQLVWLSEPRARHSRNLDANRSAAIAVHDSHQAWGDADRGLQLFGRAQRAEGAAAEAAAALYAGRFAAFDPARPSAYAFYVFRPNRLRLFDERALGGGTFVTARVDRAGKTVWERTEIYESAS
jgi:uncharacterized protein YhbP (UPF0306 family)